MNTTAKRLQTRTPLEMCDYLASLSSFIRYFADDELIGQFMFVIKSRSGMSFLSSSAASATRALQIIKEHKELGLCDTVCLRDDDSSIVVVPEALLVAQAEDEGWIV